MNNFALACVADADAEGFNFNITLDEVYTTAGDGYWSDVVKNVRVTDMGIYVNTTGEEYAHGDFYVLYDESTWDMDNDGLIYTDSAFKANVQDFMRDSLLRMGVDDDKANELVADISYSEQGMQDYGRVSFDAYELADFLRDFYKQYA